MAISNPNMATDDPATMTPETAAPSGSVNVAQEMQGMANVNPKPGLAQQFLNTLGNIGKAGVGNFEQNILPGSNMNKGADTASSVLGNMPLIGPLAKGIFDTGRSAFNSLVGAPAGVTPQSENPLAPSNPPNIEDALKGFKSSMSSNDPGAQAAISQAISSGATPPSAWYPGIAQNVPTIPPATPDQINMDELLKKVSSLPPSAFGAPKGVLGGLLSVIQGFGAGLGGHPEQSLGYQSMQKRQELAQNIVGSATAYKYNSAFQRLQQQFQAALYAKETYPGERNIAIQNALNAYSLLIPSMTTDAQKIPTMLNFLGPDAKAALLGAGGQAIPNPALPTQGGAGILSLIK